MAMATATTSSLVFPLLYCLLLLLDPKEAWFLGFAEAAGEALMSVSADGYAKEWNDVGGGDSVVSWTPGASPEGELYRVQYSPNGAFALIGTGAGWSESRVSVFDTVLEAHVIDFTNHNVEISAAAWSPDGELIVSGDYDGIVFIWLRFSAEIMYSYSGHTAGGQKVLAAAWSRNDLIATVNARTVLCPHNAPSLCPMPIHSLTQLARPHTTNRPLRKALSMSGAALRAHWCRDTWSRIVSRAGRGLSLRCTKGTVKIAYEVSIFPPSQKPTDLIVSSRHLQTARPGSGTRKRKIWRSSYSTATVHPAP